MICKILGLFFNTLTANEKDSVLNRDNLLQHLQMQLSQNLKKFSEFFVGFWKSGFNFEHFQEKGDLHSLSGFELTDSEKRG